MKKYLSLFFMAMMTIVSCQKFDDSDIWDKLNDHETRIAYLEEVCKNLNTSIVNLQTIVTALETNDYIISASPLVTGDGYTFLFKSGKSIVIYNGKDGQNGTDGVTPVISVKQDTDGYYYWTVNGEWLLVDGNKVKAAATDGKNGENGSNGTNGVDGITPKFKIEEDYWYVSYDNGQTWEKLGKATGSNGQNGADGDAFFKSVDVSNKDYIILVLSDGQTIKLPTASIFENISDIMSMIQSLVFLSNYSDGTVDAMYSLNGPETAEFNYMIRPESAAAELAKLGTTAISVKAFYTKTRANFELIELPIVSISSTSSILTVTVSLENLSNDFFNGSIGASAYMLISDGLNDLTSDTVTLIPKYNDSSTINLSENGSANCYIVSNPGAYKFIVTKGNSNESVGQVATADVLWESFGTEVAPYVGDIVKNVRFDNGVIRFDVHSTNTKGNAVIAARNSSGTILWSWHIWLTDKPNGQSYYNNAGIMMDRNLGATSVSPGNVGALGLLYQWGRKDPFLGSSSTSSGIMATSTISWPKAVTSDSNTGTITYATENPTIFISWGADGNDWLYTESSSPENKRWTMSTMEKSIYDPCPNGWRVPDGGSNGIWAKAVNSSEEFNHTYNTSKHGMDFSGKFGASSSIWYPAAGFRSGNGTSFSFVNLYGYYWSASTSGKSACLLDFTDRGKVYPSYTSNRSGAMPVRCIHE